MVSAVKNKDHFKRMCTQMPENQKVNVVRQLRELQAEFQAVADAARKGAIRSHLKSNRNRVKEYEGYAGKVGKAADKFETPDPIDDLSALVSLERLKDRFKENADAVENVKSITPFGQFIPDFTPKAEAAPVSPARKYQQKLETIIAQVK